MFKATFPHKHITLNLNGGESVLDAARAAGIILDTPCDGNGTCGKCRVKITPAHLAQTVQGDALTHAERKDGWFLACQTTLHGTVSIECDDAVGDGLQILSDGHQVNVALRPWIQKVFQPEAAMTQVLAGGDLLATETGNTTAFVYGLSIDIGTTTLVTALIDLRTGRELAAASSLNPQARYAQDVLSRIKLGSQPEGLRTLHQELIQELNRHIAEVSATAGIISRHIYEAVFSGNTTMLHLAVNADPTSLGKFPYPPKIRGGGHSVAADIGLAVSPHGRIFLPPIMSAYVGADITSGILATKLWEQPGVVLFVDIGTNGEMVLAANGKLTATSTAAGPAFEGMNIACGMRANRGAIERVTLNGKGVEFSTIANSDPVGLCGSGLLDAVGELAAHWGVDSNGRFRAGDASWAWKSNWESLDGKPIFRISGPVYLSQKDVRQVQLAKAAVRAGIELMLKANDLTASQVDRVLIAGSFGFHLKTDSLVNLGLLPRDFQDRVEFVGNTSKSGGRAFLLDHQTRPQMQQLTEDVRVLELANDPAFEKTFVRSLSF